MRYSLPVLICVLVVTATVTGGAPALSPGTASPEADRGATDAVATPIVTTRNSSSYLAIPDSGSERTRFGNASLDFGAAVALDSTRLHESLAAQTAIEAFRAAPNTSAKTAVLRRTAANLENRTTQLFQRQQRSVEQFDDGRISAALLFRRLAEIDSRAQAIHSSAQRIERVAGNTGGYVISFDLSTRFNNVERRTGLLSTGLRDSVADSLAGVDDSQQYLVTASNDAFVVAGVDQGQYVREAYIDSRYQRDGSDRFDGDLGAAIDYVYELYPWAEDNQRRPYPDIEPIVSSIYRATINHKHGRLVTYLDGSNGEIFFETQEKRLSTLPVGATVTERNATAGLAVQVNLTHPTGPMAVTVRDTTSGDPVDARIVVDGQFVGETDADGRLWTVQPEASTRIAAVAGEDRVAFTVTNVDTGG